MPKLSRQKNTPPALRTAFDKGGSTRRGPWKTVTAGSVVVKLYATHRAPSPGGEGRGEGGHKHKTSHAPRSTLPRSPYTIAWRSGADGHRQRAMRSDPFRAVSFAEAKAAELANGEMWRSQLTQADWASHIRCQQILAPTKTPMELACSIYTDSVQKLPPGCSIDEAITFFLEHRPGAGVQVDKLCPLIFDEMLLAREKDGASRNTLADIKSRVKKFVDHFGGPIQSVTADAINAWLRNLPGTRRTRNNYRGNIVDFYRYAREAGYIPKNWNPLDNVPRVKNETVRIIIFTPEEMSKLLAARVALEESNSRAKRLVPFMVIAAFAGVRHEEMCAPDQPVLDWRQIDLDKREIHVLPEVARKIGRDRITPIQPNLAAWLERYAKSSGPVCELDNATNGLLDAAHRAGLSWKDNGLRKSFISYRLALTENIGTVASEAGTSPDRIRHNYKKTVPKREATKWFDLHPHQAAILQLNFAGL